MNDLLYFDTEWVLLAKDLDTLQEEYPELYSAWIRKCDKSIKLGRYENLPYRKLYLKHANKYRQYIKIICISVGFYDNDNNLKITSFIDSDERELLLKFRSTLNKIIEKLTICGFGIKNYDIPYIAFRMIVNDIQLPIQLNNANRKPWEINAVDLLEELTFGGGPALYISLDEACVSLGIKSPKTDFSGEMVSNYYWNENDIETIKEYCENDVRSTALLEQKLHKYY